MKKYLALLLSVVLCIGLLTACGNRYATEDSTLFILKNGKVVCTDVKSFDINTYSEDEFKTYIKDTIKTYTDENGKNSVKLKKMSIKDSVCTLTIEYASAEDFTAFTGYNLYVGSVSEALAAGYSFDGEFASVDGDSIVAASADSFTGDTDRTVVILDTAYNVNVNGTILYLSTDDVSLVNKNTVSFADGNVLTGSASQDTQAGEMVTEGTEALETTEDTDSASDGSVSDDDWVLEEETETIPEFDFSDSEENAAGSSLGTLYIIY